MGGAVEGEGEREIDVRADRVDAGDDHSLTLVEIPASGDRRKRIDVFLAPDSDLDVESGQPPKLRLPLRLHSISEESAPDYTAVVTHVDAGASLMPTLAAFRRALAPIVAEIEKRR